VTSSTLNRWAAAAAGFALAAAIVARAGAQTQPPPTPPTPPQSATTQDAPAPSKSTSAGVYSAAQAEKGQETFANICQGCHTAADYTNPKFREMWNGRPLAELYAVISETMPEDSPGSLTPPEYARVIAYLLKINRLPEGKEDLPSDPAVLKDIKIDFGSSSTTERD
jgi:mono/diheme cytochrome c family protein